MNNNENGINGFINELDAINLLGISTKQLNDIVAEYKIDVKEHTETFYYSSKDIDNLMKNVERFHQEHYHSKYVFDNLISKNDLRYFNLDEVIIPKYYKDIKTSSHKKKSSNIYYKISEIEKVLKKLSYFINREQTLELLEIDSSKYVLKDFVDNFGIRTLKLGVNILYNSEDVNKAVEEIRDFYAEHYTSGKVSELLNIKNIDKKINITSVDIPKHYRGLLPKSFESKNRIVVFKKVKLIT